MDFTLDQLVVLDAIAREGSFAAAAAATHRSTPAVSYAIKSLEQALDLSLFDRSGHRAALTREGRLVLSEARAVLQRTRALGQTARLLTQEWESRLVIVVDGLLPQRRTMLAVQRLSELGAPTQVRVAVEYLSGVHRRFEQEQADLMIALDPPASAEHTQVDLAPIAVHLCAHRDHPLAALDTVTRADFAEHIELVVADSGRSIDDQTHRLWLGSPHLFQVSDFHTKAQAVREGVGFGWLPEHLVHDDLDRGELVELPFEEGSIHRFQPRLIGRRRPAGRAERFVVEAVTATP